MEMASIEVYISKDAKNYIMDTSTALMRNALLIYPCIANDTITHGRAAELLGISKMELIEIYSSLGISYFNMSDEEFEEEISTVQKLAGVMV